MHISHIIAFAFAIRHENGAQYSSKRYGPLIKI